MTYSIELIACSNAGCTAATTVEGATAELPPDFVARPILTVLGSFLLYIHSCRKNDMNLSTGTNAIKVLWLKPSVMNGVLQTYSIYVARADEPRPGDVMWNETQLFTDYTLRQLDAGTEYHISVAGN